MIWLNFGLPFFTGLQPHPSSPMKGLKWEDTNTLLQMEMQNSAPDQPLKPRQFSTIKIIRASHHCHNFLIIRPLGSHHQWQITPVLLPSLPSIPPIHPAYTLPPFLQTASRARPENCGWFYCHCSQRWCFHWCCHFAICIEEDLGLQHDCVGHKCQRGLHMDLQALWPAVCWKQCNKGCLSCSE